MTWSVHFIPNECDSIAVSVNNEYWTTWDRTAGDQQSIVSPGIRVDDKLVSVNYHAGLPVLESLNAVRELFGALGEHLDGCTRRSQSVHRSFEFGLFEAVRNDDGNTDAFEVLSQFKLHRDLAFLSHEAMQKMRGVTSLSVF